jgi:hypothetical protein
MGGHVSAEPADVAAALQPANESSEEDQQRKACHRRR